MRSPLLIRLILESDFTGLIWVSAELTIILFYLQKLSTHNGSCVHYAAAAITDTSKARITISYIKHTEDLGYGMCCQKTYCTSYNVTYIVPYSPFSSLELDQQALVLAQSEVKSYVFCSPKQTQ